MLFNSICEEQFGNFIMLEFLREKQCIQLIADEVIKILHNVPNFPYKLPLTYRIKYKMSTIYLLKLNILTNCVCVCVCKQLYSKMFLVDPSDC